MMLLAFWAVVQFLVQFLPYPARGVCCRAASSGNFAKFAAPTIANGHVYLPTFSNQVVVYGLR